MQTPPILRKTHPLVLAAAASVLVMSLVGIGVFTGLIPSAHSFRGEQSSQVAANTAAAPDPGAATVPESTAVLPPVPSDQNPAAAASAPPAAPAPPPPVGPVDVVPAPPAPPPSMAAAPCDGCGSVDSVRSVEAPGRTTGAGAVAGGVGGAVVGNMIGRGRDRPALTILGAVGGAFAGNAIEKHAHQRVSYRVRVRMDDGSHRIFWADNPAAYAVGERVRVDRGALVHAG